MVDYILLEEYAKEKVVLFIEDDENIIKETSELLELIFPKVDIARDGEEGISKYLDYKNKTGKYYDLVITDIQMPNLNGIELTKLIYKENKDQLLIVLSAHSESHYLLELVNLGISHFIPKPLKYDTFVHVIYTKLKEFEDAKPNKENTIDNLVINIDNDLIWNKEIKQIHFKNENIKLTKKEILLIDLLMKQNEQTHSVERILSYLWTDDENSAPDIINLKNVISRLRKKLPTLDIENVYGFGYRINLK